MKKLLAMFLAILVIAVGVPFAAGAAEILESGVCGDNITWTFDENYKLTFSGTGEMDDFDIFEAPNIFRWAEQVVIENGITSIGNNTFLSCDELNSITIPESVKRIGEYAFDYCSNLQSITLPDGLTDIGECAFSNCSSLQSITLPDGLESIGNGVLSSCSNLSSITLPDSLIDIGEWAFEGCENLQNISIPENLNNIGAFAFYDCSALESITIPKNVTSIGEQVFLGCSSLTNINVDKDNQYYTSVDGVLFDKEKTVLMSYPINKSGKSYNIPDSVSYIDSSAFDSCKLESITIPNSVYGIDYAAFSECNNLVSITLPESVEFIGNSVFSTCNSLTHIYVDKNNRQFSDINGVLFNKDKTMLITYPFGKTEAEYAIPNGVTKIELYAFSGCKNLESINIPNSVSYIGPCAFYECFNLTDITIPSSVKSIDEMAFYGCTSFKNITIPNGIKSLNVLTFYGCSELESITIPASVTSINCSTFVECGKLKDIYYAGSSNEWDNINFVEHGIETFPDVTVHCMRTCVYFKDSDNSIIDAQNVERSQSVNISLNPTKIGYIFKNWNTEIDGTGTSYVPGDLVKADEDVILYAQWENKYSGVDFDRLSGKNRIVTAIEIANKGWDSADTVILANGFNFADALAGGSLSYALDAPILLTANSGELEENVINCINELGASNVIILGGDVAVNKDIEDALSIEYNVERIYGKTRFETAVKIADKLAWVNGGYSKDIFVAYGYNYPDALAIGPVAALKGIPILFTGTNGSINADIANYIAKSKAENATILGGEGAVPESVEPGLKKLGIKNVERIKGKNRYGTAFAIVDKYADTFIGDDIVLATGESFPDALSGVSFASKINAPIILVSPTYIADGVTDYIAEKSPKTVYVLGGTGAVSNSTVEKHLVNLK